MLVLSEDSSPYWQMSGSLWDCVVSHAEGRSARRLQFRLRCNALHCHTRDYPPLFVSAFNCTVCATEREFSTACHALQLVTHWACVAVTADLLLMALGGMLTHEIDTVEGH